MLIELIKIGLKSENQKSIRVYYEREEVGDFKADIIVEDLVIIELKSVRRIIKEFEVQLVNYLTGLWKSLYL